MELSKSPAGRSLKFFASAAWAYAGTLLMLALLEFLGFVWNNQDVVKTIFSIWYVAAMFIICLITLLGLTITSIFTYIRACKEKQKKFLLFAMPGQVIAILLMILSIVLLAKADTLGDRKVACWMSVIAGIIAIYLAIVATVFKHITWNKARKAQNQN